MNKYQQYVPFPGTNQHQYVPPQPPQPPKEKVVGMVEIHRKGTTELVPLVKVTK